MRVQKYTVRGKIENFKAGDKRPFGMKESLSCPTGKIIHGAIEANNTTTKLPNSKRILSKFIAFEALEFTVVFSISVQSVVKGPFERYDLI